MTQYPHAWRHEALGSPGLVGKRRLHQPTPFGEPCHHAAASRSLEPVVPLKISGQIPAPSDPVHGSLTGAAGWRKVVKSEVQSLDGRLGEDDCPFRCHSGLRRTACRPFRRKLKPPAAPRSADLSTAIACGGGRGRGGGGGRVRRVRGWGCRVRRCFGRRGTPWPRRAARAQPRSRVLMRPS